MSAQPINQNRQTHGNHGGDAVLGADVAGTVTLLSFVTAWDACVAVG